MYYSVKEISTAIDAAKAVINSRAKEVGVNTKNYSDCFALLVEYDIALRGEKNSKLKEISKGLKPYKDAKGFITSLKEAGFESLNDFGVHGNYEHAKVKRPKFGMIAYELLRNGEGSAMIAGDGHWISTCNEGVQMGRKLVFYELRLLYLATPLRS